MTATRRWFTVLALVAVGLLGTAQAVPAADRYGASLGPSPLIIEDWPSPTIYLANIGSIPVDAALSIEGDGYALGDNLLTDVQPGTQQTVPITSVGSGPATVTATVTNRLPGQDKANLQLVLHVRHMSPLERFANDYGADIAAVVLVLSLIGIVGVRRRRQQRSPA